MNFLSDTFDYLKFSFYRIVGWYYSLGFKHDVEPYSRKFRLLPYWFNDVRYNLLIRYRRGPTVLEDVVSHQGRSVLEDVATFMGPNYDFHGARPTPADLGYERLVFYYRDGTVYTFEKDDEMGDVRNYKSIVKQIK